MHTNCAVPTFTCSISGGFLGFLGGFFLVATPNDVAGWHRTSTSSFNAHWALLSKPIFTGTSGCECCLHSVSHGHVCECANLPPKSFHLVRIMNTSPNEFTRPQRKKDPIYKRILLPEHSPREKNMRSIVIKAYMILAMA